MKTARVLFALTKEIKSLFSVMAITIVSGFLGVVFAMALPILGTIIVLSVLGLASPTTPLMIVLGIAGITRGMFRYVEHYTGHYVAFRILAIFRDRIFRKMRQLAPAKLDRMKTGDLVNLITSDVETLEVFYAHTVSPIAIAFFSSALLIALQSTIIHPWMGIVSLVIYCFVGIVTPMISSARIQRAGFSYRDRLNQYSNQFVEGVMGMRSLIVYKTLDRHVARIHDLGNQVQRDVENMSSRQAKNEFVIDLVVKFGIALFAAVAGVLFMNQILSEGQLILSIIGFGSSFGPLIALANLPSNLNQTVVSGKRILDILHEQPTNKENDLPMDLDLDRFEMKQVCFGYDSDEPVIEMLDLSHTTNEIIGIHGASGLGKSTILKLLMYFYAADKGNIDFNGIHVEAINTSLLRDHLGLIMQQTYIFNKSIRDNIDLWHTHTTEEIKVACERAGIMMFIESLVDGLDTVIGDKGREISFGERQRIGLARVFLKDTKFILLDEPTSNLDSYNESIILNSIVKMSRDCTVIIVSHKQMTLAICDKVYRLEDKHLILEKA